MPELDFPHTISEYVQQQIEDQPETARIVVVFDPFEDLQSGDIFAGETSRRVWHVLRYDGNDLAFRRDYLQDDSSKKLIWVVAQTSERSEAIPTIFLHSMIDIWQRADVFIDASLPGILRHIVPHEFLPIQPVVEMRKILGQNLPQVIAGLKEMRRSLGNHIPIDAHVIRGLALSCFKPEIAVQRLLFQQDTPARVLHSYLDLLWSTDWQMDGLSLLQTQVRLAPRLNLQDIEAWLDVPPRILSLYLYLRRMLGQYRVPNVANQLRGLGLHKIDTFALERHIAVVLEQWERSRSWRSRVIQQAEEILEQEGIHLSQILQLLKLSTTHDVLKALTQTDMPALISVLLEALLQGIFHHFQENPSFAVWQEYRPHLLGNLPETAYTSRVRTLTALLDELAFVDACLCLTPLVDMSISDLLDWYVANKLYDIEYANVRARRMLRDAENVLDDDLAYTCKRYIAKQQQRVKTYLDYLDRSLAHLIAINWNGYLEYARTSTKLIENTIKRHKLHPTAQRRLWVVVFDGMRWDSWARHIKPELLDLFEFVSAEKPYLCLLPSCSDIARTGLFAGKHPGLWRNDDNMFTKNQRRLASHLFGISRQDQSRKLQFCANMETDRKYEHMQNATSYPYNILIFNVSDDLVHSHKGDLIDLNEVIKALLKNILLTLKKLVGQDDTVVLTSDHGFVELGEDDSVVINENHEYVQYRYLNNIQRVDQDAITAYAVTYPAYEHTFTVAVGRSWFKRAGSHGSENRYAHGGLSLAEMTVPCAVLRRITQKRAEMTLSIQPSVLDLIEGEEAVVRLLVMNTGNVPLNGFLTVQADTEQERFEQTMELYPGEKTEIPYGFTAHYRLLHNGKAEMTQSVNARLSYTNLDDTLQTRKTWVAVQVTARTDKVEFELGDLSKLDI